MNLTEKEIVAKPPEGEKATISKTQLNYTTRERDVASEIKRRPRISRAELSRRTKLTDRQVRKTIESLRKKGERICSSSHEKGYWYAKTDKEYQDFRTEYIAGAVKRFETVKAMDGKLGGQYEMLML